MTEWDEKGESIEGASSDIWFYAYLGSETLWQTNASWGSIDMVYASGIKIATIDSSIEGCFCTTKYYHLDTLGSTRLVTSPSKSVTFTDGYQPFGQDNGTPNNSENYKFTGKPVSQTTGLYYYYQRWYDPSVGRFLSVDPSPGSISEPQSFNPYMYVGNSPVSRRDSNGECWCLSGLVSWVSSTVVSPVVNTVTSTGSAALAVTTSAVNKVTSTVANVVTTTTSTVSAVTSTITKTVVSGAEQLASQSVLIATSAYNTLASVGSTISQGTQNMAALISRLPPDPVSKAISQGLEPYHA